MPTTTIAKRMYFSNPARTTGSTTKRRRMASMASLEIQAIVAERARARRNEAANKFTNIVATPGAEVTFQQFISNVSIAQIGQAQLKISRMFPKHHASRKRRLWDLDFHWRESLFGAAWFAGIALLAAHFADAHDDICNQGEHKKHQQHPGNPQQ